MWNTSHSDLVLRVATAPRPELPQRRELEIRRIAREVAQGWAGRVGQPSAEPAATIVRIPEQRRPALAADIDESVLVDA